MQHKFHLIQNTLNYLIILRVFYIIRKMQERKTNKNNNGAGAALGISGAADGSAAPQNLVLKLEEDIKASIFSVMYLLLKESDISFWKFAILLFIEFLQMIQYCFADSMQTAWKSDGVYYYVSTFLSFSHIVPWMKSVDLISYLAIFYLCVFITMITIVAFIYVNYSASRIKTAFIWPQQLLRQMCFLLCTFFYIPILELFSSMLVCEQRQTADSLQLSKQIHYIYVDFECWTGVHIIHAAFSIAASIVFILVSFLVTLTFFKSMQSGTDASAKCDSRLDVQRLIVKTVIVYSFTFLYEQQHQWFLIALFLILTALTFERSLYLRSYFDESVQTLQNCLRGLALWTNFSLFISKLLDRTNFNGGLQLYFLGIPLIIALILFMRDNRKEELMVNVSTFQQGEDVSRQIRFYLQVLHKRDHGDRNAEIVLKGYIYSHEETCPNQQCQLKQYKKNIVAIGSTKSKKGKTGNSAMNTHAMMSQKQDNQQLLLQHAKNMFRIGIQKFPNCVSLRISYAFFLIERLNKKQEAILELQQASALSPTFDEQFVIYRYKKLSEEYTEDSSSNVGGVGGAAGKAENANQNAVDIMTRFAFESTFRQLQHQIEKCAHFHIEFWNYLKDDRPDLGKLGDCGSRINTSIVNVEQIWSELQKLNSNAPKAMKLYGRFLLEILHDKESGQEYLQRAKDVANLKQNFVLNNFEDVNDMMQVSSDGTPCIVVSGEPDKISVITHCNSGAVRIFGYQQYEIRNQKVEKLMPELYGKHHSKILEEALSKGPENIPSKERLIYAKHKSGYIFPVWLQLKLIQSMNSEIQFIALFKVDKRIMNSNIAFLLVNREKKVQGISSSCMKMMNLDINKLRRMNNIGYDLHKLVPDYDYKKDELTQSKIGIPLEWNIPTFTKKRWVKAVEIERITAYQKKLSSQHQHKEPQAEKGGGRSNIQDGGGGGGGGSLIAHAGQQQIQRSGQLGGGGAGNENQLIKKKYRFMSTLTPIMMGAMGEIGICLRLDILKTDGSNGPKAGAHIKSKECIKQPLFQFRFDIYSGRFLREIREGANLLANKNPFFFEDDNQFKQSTVESTGEQTSQQNMLLDRVSGDKKVMFKSHNEVFELTGTSNQALTHNPLDKLTGGNKHPQISGSTPGDEPSEPTAGGDAQPIIQQEDLHIRKKRWGKGIAIYTLREGRVQLKDFIDEEKKLMELDDQKRRKQEEDERNMQELTNFSNNIKSKKALRSALNDTSVPPAIRNLRFTMNFVVFCLLALAISEFTVISDQFQEINENFGLIQKSYRRISEVQRVAYDIRTLILINEGRLKIYPDYTISSVNFKEYLKQDLELALNSLYDLQDYISLSQLPLSDEHQIIVSQKVVPLYFKESQLNYKIINFTLSESVLQMSSAIFTVRHLSIDSFNENQEDVFFVIYNAFNDFLIAMLKSSDYYEQELYQRSSQKNNLLLILFLSSLGTVCLSLPILFPAVNSVNKTKDRVLTLFIEIPNVYIAELSVKCETFLGSLYDDQQEEVKSIDDSGSQGGSREIGSSEANGSGQKRNIAKQPKNTSNTNRNFFIQSSFAVLLIIAYFSSMFGIAKNYINNMDIITRELSIAAYNEAHFSFLQNTQREMIYNKDRKILNQNSFEVSKKTLLKIYDHVQLFLNLHQENRNVLNEDYKLVFDKIMNNNLCESEYINQSLLPVQCSTLFNDGPTHGLQSVIIMYFELLRETLNLYKNQTQPAVVIPPPSPSAQPSIKVVRAVSTKIPPVEPEATPTSSPPKTATSTNTTTPSNSTTTNSTTNTTSTNSTAVKPNTTTNATTPPTPAPPVVTPTPPPVVTPPPPAPIPTPPTPPTTTNTTIKTNSTNTTTTTTMSAMDQLLNSQQFKLLYWMQYRFLQDAFRILVQTLKTTTNTSFQSTVNTKMAVFIVFVILVALSYLILWTPFVNRLNRDIWRTKMMLTIIPIQIIMKIPKIQEYLNKQNFGGGSKGSTPRQNNEKQH